MPVNPPPVPSNSSLPPVDCLILPPSTSVLTSFSIVNILLVLPLVLFVFYLGYQRRRQRRNIPAAETHSDIFTYHMVAMEMGAVLACLLYCVGLKINLSKMFQYVFDIFFALWSIKIFFHTLTCVDRYLAVVHSVSYRALKSTGGVRIRNVSIACVWLLCFSWGILISLVRFYNLGSPECIQILYFCLLAFSLTVICFCCISVLCALRRPGPGEASGDREQGGHMKRRAFNTVVIIMGVLWLCLAASLVCNAVQKSHALSESDGCAVQASTVWFSLPSSLVLPLLYLHRAGKLPGCKYRRKLGI